MAEQTVANDTQSTNDTTVAAVVVHAPASKRQKVEVSNVWIVKAMWHSSLTSSNDAKEAGEACSEKTVESLDYFSTEQHAQEYLAHRVSKLVEERCDKKE